ncbi:MAG TPA: class I SAM-dependent methyltransferase [Candidatus Babeliaceae bacterium]|nr:class I SAM-dependent methyltransferase [Candidatus Babeliaceae bacterium]
MYGKLCTEFYDLVEHSDGAAALRFYREYALQSPGPILEPMCGTGRFLIPLLQLGLDIEGFDISEDMLHALKEKWAGISDTPAPVWRESIQNFKTQKLYSLIFIPYGSWGHILDKESALGCLINIYNHLLENGKLILAIDTIYSVSKDQKIWTKTTETKANGQTVSLNSYITYNRETQYYHTLCIYESTENVAMRETQKFEMYLYRVGELDSLLEQAGFKEIQIYQNYRKDPITNPQAKLLIYEATK